MNNSLLKAKRVEHNLKQKELAQAMGISQKTYCLKENATDCTFSGQQILQLKEILKLSLSEVDSIFFDGALLKTK